MGSNFMMDSPPPLPPRPLQQTNNPPPLSPRLPKTPDIIPHEIAPAEIPPEIQQPSAIIPPPEAIPVPELLTISPKPDEITVIPDIKSEPPQITILPDPVEIVESDFFDDSDNESVLMESLAAKVLLENDPGAFDHHDRVLTDEPEEMDQKISSLGRRKTTLRRIADKIPGFEENPVYEDPILRKALDELEDTEVKNYLAKVGSNIQEFKLVDRHEPKPWPPLSLLNQGNFVYISAAVDSAASNFAPICLKAPPPFPKFSLRVSRNQLERAYQLCPPSMWGPLVRGDFAKVYRWQSKYTLPWCLTYIILWFYDLILLAPFAILLYHLFKVRLNPPTVEDILLESKMRDIRAREAHELSKQVAGSKFGFATAAAKTVFKGFVGSNKQNSLVDNASLYPGSDDDAASVYSVATTASGRTRKRDRIKKVFSVPVVVEEPGIGDLRSPDEVLDTLQHGKQKAPVDEHGNLSLFELGREALSVFGPSVQEIVAMGADIGEQLKNLFVHPDHPAVPGVMARLCAICLFIIFCPAWILIKLLWAYAGFEFFVLWKLREDLPSWRRALMPWSWILLDTPTDAEYAIYILRKRARQQTMLYSQGTGSGLGSGIDSVVEPTNLRKRVVPSKASHSYTDSADIGIAGVLRKQATDMSLGIVPSHQIGDLSLPQASVSNVTLSTQFKSSFAFLVTMPGTLEIDGARIRFLPTKGLRKFGLLRRSLGKEETDIFSVKNHDSTPMMDILVDDLVSMRKETHLTFDGLRLETKDGKVYDLRNVADRDEMFNHIAGSGDYKFKIA